MLTNRLTRALAERHARNETRHLEQRHSAQAAVVSYPGGEFINFCSNDYLGLANHPAVTDAFKIASNQYGVGSGAAVHISGYTDAHAQLESELAQYLGREAVILFSTGYMANLGVVTALTQAKDLILSDKANHASLVDGCRYSDAISKRFPHLDYAVLTEKLSERPTNQPTLIVSDAVFSMRGEMCDIKTLSSLAKAHQAHLLLDDAHGVGYLGSDGRGTLSEQKIPTQDIDILTGTFGKAFGSFGAYVSGSKLIVDALRQFSRPYMYTTGLPPAIAAATLKSLTLIRDDENLRNKLKSNIRRFTEQSKTYNLPLLESSTAIQCLKMNSPEHAKCIASKLREQGLLVKAIVSPTVPRGEECLRIALSAKHDSSHIDQLLEAIDHVIHP